MNFNRRRSGGIMKKRKSFTSMNRSRISKQSSFGQSTLGDQQDDHCIKVVVRARPFNSKETGKGNKILEVVDDNLLVFDPPVVDDDFFFHGQKQHVRDLNKRVNKNIRFLFDKVFDDSSSNEQVFSEAVKPIIDNLLSGFNCSVFAYGATGAGKTFTMLGAKSHPGIIYLIVQDLFHRMGEMENKTCELNISYLEVYNETVKDLLRPSPPLQIRDDSKNIVVAGLTFQKPTNAEDLLNLLHFGNQNRTQHPTDANAESSRSHAVFQIYLRVKDRVGGLSESIQLSKLSLIDLAGSERACVVSNRGRARQREGANINQSLLALGSCINALASKNGKCQHIPYRNSKLTRLLKDSLGGNCKTVMIAAISPSSLSYEDTYNTLKYADRAKEIKVSLKRNAAHVDAHLGGYKTIVSNLQKENESLKRQLAEMTSQEPEAKRRKVSTSESSVQTVPLQTLPAIQGELENVIVDCMDSEWKENVDSLFHRLMKYKANILNCESNILSTQARQFWRQFGHDRVSALTSDANKISRSHSKLDTLKNSNYMKADRLNNEKLKNLEQYQKIMEILNSLETAQNTELGRMLIQNHKSQLENLSLQNHLTHVLELSTANFKQTYEAWKLCEQALQLARKQQSLLKGHGYLTSQLTSQFDDLLKQAECGREVAWADIPLVPNALHQEFIQHLLLPSSGFETQLACSGPVEPLPLFTYADRTPEVSAAASDSSFVFAMPSTPCRNSQPLPQPNFESPPCSSVQVYAPPAETTSNPHMRHGSPHPNKCLNKMSNKELLDLLNKAPVRRPLEETFVSSSQDIHAIKSTVEWQASPANLNLENLNFSPVSFAHSIQTGHTRLVSTPRSERQTALSADAFSVTHEPHSTVNKADLHSCLHLEQAMRASPCSCEVTCQQAHLKAAPTNVYFLHHTHDAVPQCPALSLQDVGSPRILTVQQQQCLPQCPATVVRPSRLAPLQRNQDRVVSVLPNPRAPSGATMKNQPRLSSVRHISQGSANPRQLVSTNVVAKENSDPMKAIHQKNVKRISSAVQRRPTTPSMKLLKRNPTGASKTGK